MVSLDSFYAILCSQLQPVCLDVICAVEGSKYQYKKDSGFLSRRFLLWLWPITPRGLEPVGSEQPNILRIAQGSPFQSYPS